MASPPPDPLALLLQKTLDGAPRLTFSKGGAAPVEGLFPAGAAGKKQYDAAKTRELVEDCPGPNPPKRGKAVPHARLTSAGRQWVLSHVSPKAALEALPGALARVLSTGVPDPKYVALADRVGDFAALLDAMRNDIQKAADKHEKAVENVRATFAQLQQEIRGAGTTSGGPTAEVRALLAEFAPKVTDAVAEVRELETTATPVAPSPTPIAPPPMQPVAPPTPLARLGGEVVRFVEQFWLEHARACKFNELKAHLDRLPPVLSIGEFQDLLRALHDSRRIQLADWGQSQDDLPEPKLALILSRKVLYYVEPIDRSR